MRFRPTAKCPKVPTSQGRGRHRKPVPHLSDEDVDLALEHMLEQIGTLFALPATQYGRRIAVEAYLAYERIRPLSQEFKPWTPVNPVQPR